MYTKEQVEVFNKMFKLVTGYEIYIGSSLTENGLVEGKFTSDDREPTEEYACITLSNGTEYEIDYGDCSNTEERLMNAFDKFVELNYNEELFKGYLENESRFETY